MTVAPAGHIHTTESRDLPPASCNGQPTAHARSKLWGKEGYFSFINRHMHMSTTQQAQVCVNADTQGSHFMYARSAYRVDRM